MPEIVPIIAPKMMSFNKFRFMANEPSSMENTRKARIVNKTPIIAPQSQPFVFIFFPKTKHPTSIERAFITWFMG